MIWLALVIPITIAISMYLARKPHKQLDPQVAKQLDREHREDIAIAALEERFVNGDLTMEQLAEETELVLKGESNEQRRLRQEGTLLYHDSMEYMPPPKMVREYSYPAAPGWPDTDPPIECNICGKQEAYDPKRGPYCKKCWQRQTQKQQKVLYDLEKQRMFPQRYVETEDGCYICMGKGNCLCPDCANLTVNEKRMAAGF